VIGIWCLRHPDAWRHWAGIAVLSVVFRLQSRSGGVDNLDILWWDSSKPRRSRSIGGAYFVSGASGEGEGG